MYLDAFYATFIHAVGKDKGKVKTTISQVVKDYCRYKYVSEASLMKNYLRRKLGKQLNIVSAEDVLNFISKYIK